MFWRLHGPLIAVAFFGLVPIVTFFLSEDVPGVGFVREKVETWMIIIYGFALLLGVVNVIQTNVRKIERKDKGWPFSISLLLGLLVTGVFGILSAFEVGAFQGLGARPDGSPTPFHWMTTSFFNPLQAAMFSLLAFYIASAAFRAFRVRNVEATILLVAAMIVMLGRIPFGEVMLSWIPGGEKVMPTLTEWIMDTPNAAAQRGIIIGAALGAASLSLRVILGIERAYLGLGRE